MFEKPPTDLSACLFFLFPFPLKTQFIQVSQLPNLHNSKWLEIDHFIKYLEVLQSNTQDI